MKFLPVPHHYPNVPYDTLPNYDPKVYGLQFMTPFMNLNDEKNIHDEKNKDEQVEANFHLWMSAQRWSRLETLRRHRISHFLLSEHLIMLLHRLQPDPIPLNHLVMPLTRLNDPFTNHLLEDVIHRQTHEITRDLHHHIIYEVPLPPDEDLL